jgi:hypothetical protein
MPIAVPIGKENNLKQPKTSNRVRAQGLLFRSPTPPMIDGIEKNSMITTAIMRIKGTSQTKTHSASGPASSIIKGMMTDRNAVTKSIPTICSEPEIM